MGRPRESIFYPLSVLLLLAAGLVLSLFVLGGLLGLEPFTALEPYLGESDGAALLFIFAGLGGLLVVSGLIYAASLDPFRAERPWGWVYLNFLPLSTYVAVIFLAMSLPGKRLPGPVEASAALAISALGPLLALAAESLLGAGCLALGRWFDDRHWNGAAFFLLKNSLRWRPSVRETARRCGLLLAEMGRLEASRGLLERLGPVDSSDDPDVLRALERAYLAAGERLPALRCLQRQQALKPGGKAFDSRILEQCLGLQLWDDAAALLESGRIPMDLDQWTLLHAIHLKRGREDDALATARRIAAIEPPPKARAIDLLNEALERRGDDEELLVETGLLMLQDRQSPEHLRRGALKLERALELNPGRNDLRKILAAFHRETMQNEKAERHLRRLVEGGDEDPETHLALAEILRLEGLHQEAVDALRRLRLICPEEPRAPLMEAEILLAKDRLDEAASAAERARELAGPEGAAAALHLKRRIEQRRDEALLRELDRQLGEAGDDPEKRLEFIGRLVTLDRAEQALAECDRLLERDPSRLDAVREVIEKNLEAATQAFRLRDYLAGLHFRRGRFDEALEVTEAMAASSLHPDKVIEDACRRILEREPGHLGTRLRLAELLRARGRWADLLEIYEPWRAAPPEGLEREVRRRWTEAAHRAGRIAEARDAGLAALEENLDDPAFLVMLIRILEEAGDYQGALEIFNQAVERHPGDEALSEMRRTVADNSKVDRMRELTARETAGELDPPGHYAKAELHREFGQIHRAIIHYQKASEDPELSGIALAKLAVCLCERRMFSMADETLDPIEFNRETAARYPELKGLYYWVADVFELEDFKEPALKYFKRLFRVDAAFRDVVIRLERLGSQ